MSKTAEIDQVPSCGHTTPVFACKACSDMLTHRLAELKKRPSVSNPPIPPALTFEQWKMCYDSLKLFPRLDPVYHAVSLTNQVTPSTPSHALAALCLYDQTFGFSRQDVEALKRSCINTRDDTPSICGDDGMLCGVCSIAARISALLPPPPE